LTTTNNFRKERKGKTNKWEDILCSWIGRVYDVKMSTLLKVTNTYNTIPIRTPMAIFAEIEKKIFKFSKDPKYSKMMPRMKNKTRALILPAFCNILKATVIKSIW
jgi:hypothetical protein